MITMGWQRRVSIIIQCTLLQIHDEVELLDEPEQQLLGQSSHLGVTVLLDHQDVLGALGPGQCQVGQGFGCLPHVCGVPDVGFGLGFGRDDRVEKVVGRLGHLDVAAA